MLTMPFHLAVADSMPPFFAGSRKSAPACVFAVAQVLPKRPRGKFPRDLFTVKNGRIAGEPIVVVVLIELEGEMRTILRSPCV
jgi:hypothetical protein